MASPRSPCSRTVFLGRVSRRGAPVLGSGQRLTERCPPVGSEARVGAWVCWAGRYGLVGEAHYSRDDPVQLRPAANCRLPDAGALLRRIARKDFRARFGRDIGRSRQSIPDCSRAFYRLSLHVPTNYVYTYIYEATKATA